MTSANTSEDLHQGRGWLNRAAEMLDACEDHVSDAEFATAAAAIGSGFVALAQAQMSAPMSMRLTSEMPPALISAVERAGRAAAEARPHDDEPVNLCETDADMAARFAGQIGELTSRIDAALKVLQRPWPLTEDHHDFVNSQVADARAALRGDQAAKEASDRG